MKKLVLNLACAFALTAHADDLSPASKAAIADGVTTAVAFSRSHPEKTQLIGNSYQNLLLATAVKVAASEYLKDNKPVEKALTVLWGSYAANNVAVIVFNSNPAGWVAGIATGWCLFKSTDLDVGEGDAK